MAIPPWTYELLRRGVVDVARRAKDTETVERLKQQASEMLQDLPEAAAKGIDAVIKKTEIGKNSIERWTQRQTHDSSPIINASGTLLHPKGTGVPMAAQAIELGRELVGGDINHQLINRQAFEQRLQKLAPNNDSNAIYITTNPTTAVTSIALLNRQATFYLHRSQCDNNAFGETLRRQLESIVKVEILEDEQRIADRQRTESSCFELVIQDGYHERLESDPIDDHQRILIADTCVFLAKLGHQIPNAQTLIKGGFDWLILPGNGLCGGPPCSIVNGPKADVKLLQSHPLWSSFEAREDTLLVMLMTLEMEASQPDAIPVLALLNTSVDNIRSRTERIATRISANEKIAECQIMDSEAAISTSGIWKVPSQNLKLRHQTLQPKQWSIQLVEEHPLILTNHDDNYLYLDLRWVEPCHDARIGRSIGGLIQ